MTRLIEEQAKRFRQFEEAAKAAPSSESFVDVDITMLMNDPEVMREQHRLYSSFQSSKSSAGPAAKVDKEKVRRYHEDTVQHLENGQTVRMKGMRHVYQSIGQGRATVVQCPNCATFLQVNQKASQAVYCVMCQQVSQLDTMLPSFAVGDDGLLAKAMQIQEAEAAQLKMKQFR
ncbi:hypothetical protein FisN_1Lh250 [Fistulifera solaris]|uniref:Uncharacterized protein n=1 Tax=Fistulifera solaris TaxID=1519565 RepID=A0A1Z5K4E2_FISSO|nr:hypothetical protein FisN_1Lh250 [Fistulifera solaris]|eukprot:GAX21076.1 hypothetical protein FisN_1Lh250 [Fistulifera solaris]